jgi:hypothetical protein
VRETRWQTFEGRGRAYATILKKADWTIRDSVVGDEREILRLCQRLFGSSLTPEEWNWRTFGNPAGKTISLVAIEKDNGRLIGHMAGVPVDLRVGQFSRKAFIVVDSVVDPLQQRRGIHAALSIVIGKRSAESEAGFPVGLPNQQAYLPVLKMGGSHLLTIPVFFKVLDWRRVVRAKLHSNFLAQIAGALGRPFQQSKAPEKSTEFTLQEVRRFESSLDELSDRVSPRFGICSKRESSLLNWRYFQRPGSPYSVFSISSGGRWQGYIVIRLLEKWGLRLGTLVDLFFDPDCALAGQLLLHHAEKHLRAAGADVLWGLFSSPQIYRKLFRKARFFKVSQLKGLRRFHLVADFVIIDSLRPDLDRRDGALLRQSDEWFLVLGDTDLA